MKEYGVLYSKVIFEKGHKLYWLNYVIGSNSLPKDFYAQLYNLVKYINKKYKDKIIIPLDLMINAGCLSNTDSIFDISSDFYYGMEGIFKTLTGDSDVMSVVYSNILLEEDDVNKVNTVHHLGHYSSKNYQNMSHFGYLFQNSKVGLHNV